jgi:hypothetical protein
LFTLLLPFRGLGASSYLSWRLRSRARQSRQSRRPADRTQGKHSDMTVSALTAGFTLWLVLGCSGARDSRATEVIIFAPPEAANITEGSCFAPSIAVTRPGAWRCAAGNLLYDPCFGRTDALELVCVTDPSKLDEAFKLRLANPLPQIPQAPHTARPWFVETSDGLTCGFLAGATGEVNGQRVNYRCSDGSYLIGDPTPDSTWTATKIAPGERLPPPGMSLPQTTVNLRRVWE